jgi:DNA-binding NtrC family response regulator
LDSDILIQPPYILGKSPKILKAFKEIKKIAPKDLSVLISGESGTYKELVARVIHDNSPRRKSPFIAISLASIPRDLANIHLFGNDKGLSDGAEKKGSNKIEEADGGTLFLDEISEMDTSLQERFIGFIEKREMGLPGGNGSFKADVRIIATTCKNLKEFVQKGQFREDLYAAFNTVHIKIPPLRDRKEDILSLSTYFLEEAVKKFETGPKEFSKEARDYLVRYDWPGNMRELENTVKRAAVLSNNMMISKKDLLMEDMGSCSIKEFLEEKLNRYLKEMTKLENCNLYDTVLSEVEKSLIAIVLKETGGNQLRAAKTLGINRNTLRTKIKEYKIRL